ncbi:flotillin family protein [Halanaerobacter jeridensis]|uniref:Membrane protein YqiK n=1 Tax=Halanaerobacter jeridensis TaxID=706427 RepID=A0A938XW26_9FIRM|nr:flotillin family protein [Halanaerobacter jeridensis]MBM7556320.1 putative membrane protein YqiK [Halanaerobacter jeridensis]
MLEMVLYVVGGILFLVFIGFPLLLLLFYKKVGQGTAIVRNGIGGAKVSFTGTWMVPILHRWETMDVSVKRVEIHRDGKDGLVCKDNLRADIKVAFFVRVNHTEEDVLRVAKSLGTKKASDTDTLMRFFDAKFSEALKTVGKKFDFTQLYTERDTFKEEILQVIGTDLNGYVLDDAAIDYLEQTKLDYLDENNVLDSEGIKKITELTATQAMEANEIQRNKEKTIVKQDVSAKEAVLELERQQAEAEEKQKREIANMKSRESAQIKTVEEEERLKSENARIKTDEEIAIAEENKDRQIIVAKKSKEATEAVEEERVTKEQEIEKTEREKVVSLAQIEKDKNLEKEKKDMQEVIRERVMVEKSVAEEEEKIKDTKELAAAKRAKDVNITTAEGDAEVEALQKIKLAEAEKQSESELAEKEVIKADTELKTSRKKAESIKIMADANAEESAVEGISDARVMKAKAEASEKEGATQAKVKEMQAEAEAKAIKLTGESEAEVVKGKAVAEAEGINKKAEAMKRLDSVGKEHEEFKLRLNKDKEIELAEINIQPQIAQAQAEILKDGLQNANVDIVGGESMFFDNLINSITRGKQVDRLVDNSDVLTDVKDTFFSGDRDEFKQEVKSLIDSFNLDSEAIKNLTISSAIMNYMNDATGTKKTVLNHVLSKAKELGLANTPIKKIME